MRKKKWTRTVTFMTLLAMILACCAAAAPRLSLWYRWPDTPRNVFFTTSLNSIAEREAARAALNQWNAVKDSSGRSPVSMYLTTGDDPDNSSIGYVTTSGTWVGRCQPYTTDGTNLYRVEVQLNTRYQYSVGAQAGKYDIQSVVLHEVGHALGVAHCHEEGQTCQFDTCTSNVMNRLMPLGATRRTFQPYDTASYLVIYV